MNIVKKIESFSNIFRKLNKHLWKILKKISKNFKLTEIFNFFFCKISRISQKILENFIHIFRKSYKHLGRILKKFRSFEMTEISNVSIIKLREYCKKILEKKICKFQ